MIETMAKTKEMVEKEMAETGLILEQLRQEKENLIRIKEKYLVEYDMVKNDLERLKLKVSDHNDPIFKDKILSGVADLLKSIEETLEIGKEQNVQFIQPPKI